MPPSPLPMKHTPMAVPRFSMNHCEIIMVNARKVRQLIISPAATDSA